MLLPRMSDLFNPDAGNHAWGIHQKRREGSQKEIAIMPKNQGLAMISCNDGFWPVSFLLEALDEEQTDENT